MAAKLAPGTVPRYSEGATVLYRVIAPPDVQATCPTAAQVVGTQVSYAQRAEYLAELRKACSIQSGCHCTLVSEDLWQRGGLATAAAKK